MQKDLTQTILDLIFANTDRIRIYEKAVERLKDEDADLKVFFTTMISNGHQYKLGLAKEFPVSVVEIPPQKDDQDKFFLLWMNVKATFTDNDRKTILTSCKMAEDATQKVYESAFNEANLNPDIQGLIDTQMQSLKACYRTVSLLCDSQVHIMMLEYV